MLHDDDTVDRFAGDGDAAVRWLRERGWIPDVRTERPLRVRAVERRLPGVSTRLIRHSDMRLRRDVSRTDTFERSVWVPVSGGGTTQSSSTSPLMTIVSGTAIVLPTHGQVQAHLDAGELLQLTLSSPDTAWPLTLTILDRNGTVGLAAAVVKALLTEPIHPLRHGRAAAAMAAEFIGAAVAAASTGGFTATGTLIERAETCLRQHAHDPDFTVTTLAEMLSVSRRHLTRVLSAAGQTPQARLREIRVARVRATIDAGNDDPLRDDLTARHYGFASARSLRDSLARAAHPGGREVARPR